MKPDKNEIAEWFRNLQNRICNGLEALDGKAKFKEELWERPEGGGGRTRVIQNGNIFEKGGVNFSAVFGPAPAFLRSKEFFATGVSIVIHPESPAVPIIHMNVRYIETDNESWFGGGIDLTPIYIDAEQARFFHQQLKQTCDRHGAKYYTDFKKWADDYFFIPHRNETRGVGGIFFDQLKAEDTDMEGTVGLPKESFRQPQLPWEFVKAVGKTFLPTYSTIVNQSRDKKHSEQQKQWQLIRRGRYAEFNLVYDRGTKFGLETNGRTESILMSLPPLASWSYNYQPAKDSEEEKTQNLLRKGINWV